MIIAILIIITVYSIIYIFFDIFPIIFVLFSLRSRQYYLRFSLYNFFSLISYLVFALIISFYLDTPFLLFRYRHLRTQSTYLCIVSIYSLTTYPSSLSRFLLFFLIVSPLEFHCYQSTRAQTSERVRKPTNRRFCPLDLTIELKHIFSLSHFRFPASASSVSTRGNRGYF